MRHSEHRSSGIGHTDNRSDHEHSVHRSRSARSNAVDHRSILLNCNLQEHRSELEHGSASNRTRHRSDVSRSSRRNSSTHHATIPLRHADPSEHSTASVLRHLRVRNRSRTYDFFLPRDHISRYADDDDEFNSHFEDLQDLAPEDETHNVFEIHSNVSSEDMRFQNFIEEVFSFFFWPTSSQRKQMRFWEGTG